MKQKRSLKSLILTGLLAYASGFVSGRSPQRRTDAFDGDVASTHPHH